MSDIKFRKALSNQIPTAEAQEFLGHLKSAGVKDVAAKGMDVLSKNKTTLLGAAIGTAVASALQYQANKPKADGSPSTQRRMAEGQLAAIEKHHGDMAAKGQEPGFADEMSHARAKGSAEVSKVMEKHPVRGALMAAPVGAMAGAGISALAKNFMKQANGDMLQYYQDHPEKLKAKQERDAKKEKKAYLGPENVLGAGLGYVAGKAQKKRGETHSFGGKQVASLLIPGAVGYQAARYVAHNTGDEHKKSKKEKKASADAIAVADAWGRELAKTAGMSFNKVNEASKMVGRISRLWEKHGPAVKQMAGAAGKKVHEGVKNVGSRLGNIKDPITRGAATGVAIGGVGGAAQGFLDPKENPYTGEKQRLRTAFRKGLSGAASGAVQGGLIGSMGKTSSVKSLEKAAAGVVPGLGAMGAAAGNFVRSMGSTAHKALNSATPALRSGISTLGKSTMGQAAGAGAVGGAALGAAKGLVAPGRDANGQQRSRLGAMAGGAAKGAAGGAAMGAGAKAALPHVQNFAAKKLAVPPKLGPGV